MKVITTINKAESWENSILIEDLSQDEALKLTAKIVEFLPWLRQSAGCLGR